jgi:hypothetical protein
MAAFILGPDLGLKLIENQEQTEGCIVTETGRWETTKFNTYRLPQ